MLKFLCLVVAIWFTCGNTWNGIHNKEITSGDFIVQAIAIVGFLYLQFPEWF